MKADRLKLAQAYDPNCDVYSFTEQRNAMQAAAQTVVAMQELARYLGRDPEGCLVDCADEAMGRIEGAIEDVESLTAKLAAFDDARAVDEVWLRSLGFKFHDGLGVWRHELPQSGRFVEVVLSKHDGGIYASQEGRGAPVHVVRLTKAIPTRGQLNHLLAALRGQP